MYPLYYFLVMMRGHLALSGSRLLEFNRLDVVVRWCGNHAALSQHPLPAYEHVVDIAQIGSLSGPAAFSTLNSHNKSLRVLSCLYSTLTVKQ